MIALALNEQQRRAVDAPFEVCVAIVGAAGTGKSRALGERLARARAQRPGIEPLVVPEAELGALAFEILELAGRPARRIDDATAAELFAQACEPLFALEWEEFAERAEAAIDPDVPGLRSPARFAEAAYRLIRKLSDGGITAERFLELSLQRGAEFYAKPPNFADPALLYATKDAYRDSLDVDAAELMRQYRRELDLAKILAKLYERYAETIHATSRMTGGDAVAAAVRLLRDDADLASRVRARFELAFVDDAQELGAAELALLQAIFGDALAGVTLAGDPGSAFSTFRGARPDAAFARAAERIELAEQQRSPLAVELAVRALVGGAKPAQAAGVETRVALHRAAAPDDEAAFIAEYVAAAIAQGTPPSRIAVILRSVRCASAYERALLQRDVPVVVEGDANLFADRRALDALALLWNVCDPFRHEWMLRTLGNPALALSDASLALLCSEPANPQRPLLHLVDEPAPTVRSSRWDPKRDLRLGWNVIRGDQDAALSPEARDRLTRWRANRERWLDAMQTLPFEDFARLVWREGLAREGRPGSARARAQQTVLRRLLARLSAYLEDDPHALVADALAYAERRIESELEYCASGTGEEAVVLAGVDAVLGREFDRVVVADVRAGAFPRWYVPDSFLFSPAFGMVPKDNAGDARAARTAKFSFYLHKNKTRERYNEEDRRALVYALRRAREHVLVTASGVPTRGVAAPEFLEELRAARTPGSEIV